jgi:cytochrome oxidase Cu insertion factor (SCO1/SenC/PrrC family)
MAAAAGPGAREAGGAPGLRALGAHELLALGALAFLAVVTVLWWAFALWPVPEEPAAWLVRARYVCFNVGPSGLPDASGWLLLIGQPIGMLAALMAIWGPAVRGGLRRLAARTGGRVLLAACALVLLAGVLAAAARVAGARSDAAPFVLDEALPETYPRLDRPAPALGLVDQSGARLELAALRGRPALVTFAFAHCEAVCPAIVRQVVEAQRRVRESAGPGRAPRVVVVTLDPWRDTPSRLPSLAAGFGLGEDGFVLSGGVDEVNALLDRWNVPRGRDEQTGEVAHPPLVYVLDAEGRIAFAATGGSEALVELLGRV